MIPWKVVNFNFFHYFSQCRQGDFLDLCKLLLNPKTRHVFLKLNLIYVIMNCYQLTQRMLHSTRQGLTWLDSANTHSTLTLPMIPFFYSTEDIHAILAVYTSCFGMFWLTDARALSFLSQRKSNTVRPRTEWGMHCEARFFWVSIFFLSSWTLLWN